MPQKYKKYFNFKVASILRFNYDLLVNEYGLEYTNNFIKQYGKADVYFMVNTNKKVKTKIFNCNNYDKAVNYRNSYVM